MKATEGVSIIELQISGREFESRNPSTNNICLYAEKKIRWTIVDKFRRE